MLTDLSTCSYKNPVTNLTRPSLHHPYCTFPLLDLGIPTLLSLFNNVFPFYHWTLAFNHNKDFPLLGEELQQVHDGTLAFFRKRSLQAYDIGN